MECPPAAGIAGRSTGTAHSARSCGAAVPDHAEGKPVWQIARNLYLGDRKDAHDRDLLTRVGVTHVVNCAAEVPCWYHRDFRYLRLPLTDPDPEFHESIETFCRFIHRGRRAGGVLVHCAAGLSRSPSVVLAYLVWRGKPLDAALERLRRRVGESDRGFIEPDASFLEQIEIHFEEREDG